MQKYTLIFAILFFIIYGVIGSLRSSKRSKLEHEKLKENGVVTEATVSQVLRVKDANARGKIEYDSFFPDEHYHYDEYVTFEDIEGNTVEKKLSGLRTTANVGDKIDIIYLPDELDAFSYVYPAEKIMNQ